MNGKKRPHNRTSNYLITTETKKLKKKQQGTLGKLRSNFLGTEFQVFDSGENPKKKVAQHKIRKQLGVVMYETNVLGSRGPRKMKVLLPAIDSHGRRALWRPMNDKEGMVQSYKAGERELIMSFINKPPEWKEQLQAYVLNFNGRVEKASVKNFQLVDKQERKPPPAHSPSRRRAHAVRTRQQARVLHGRPVAPLPLPGLFHLSQLLRLQVRLRVTHPPIKFNIIKPSHSLTPLSLTHSLTPLSHHPAHACPTRASCRLMISAISLELASSPRFRSLELFSRCTGVSARTTSLRSPSTGAISISPLRLTPGWLWRECAKLVCARLSGSCIWEK